MIMEGGNSIENKLDLIKLYLCLQSNIQLIEKRHVSPYKDFPQFIPSIGNINQLSLIFKL